MSDQESTDQGRLIRRGLALAGSYIRAHPLLFSLACVGSVIMAIGTVASTIVLGWLTDDVIFPAFEGTDADRSKTAVVIAVLAVAVGRSTGVVMRRYFAGRTVYRTKDDLQLALGDKYLNLRPVDLRVAPKGKLLAHVDSDVEVATDLLSPLPFAIGVVALLGASIVSLATLDWVLMVVAIAMMPLVVVLNQLNALAAKGPAVDSRESVGKLSTVASESFDGAIIVKTLGREDQELERFSTEARSVRDHSIRLGRVRAIFSALLDLLPDIGVVALVVLGAWRVSTGDISTGQLVQAVALFSLLVFPLRVIGYFFGDMPPSVVAYDRVARVLAMPDERRSGTVGLSDGALGVALDEVSVSHGDIAAIADVTLDVARGEVVALVGQTGCGKSTLLSTVAGMAPLSGGEIRIGGVALDDISAVALSGRVALAWQQPFLLGATVDENVAFGASFPAADIQNALRAACVEEVIAELPHAGDTVIGEGGVGLSGGQRQRLALARALVRRPGLLLLDDATSAVDPVVEEQILGTVREMGATILIVAHRRSTIALADRVVMMRSGRITASGTHNELLAEASYVALLDAYEKELAT